MKKNVWYRGVMLAGLLATAHIANADWQKTDTLNQYRINDFAVSGTNLFAATAGSGIFLSTDTGANWVPVDSGLTDSYDMCLAASGANLFAGTNSGGIFSSSNNGASWTPVDSGFPWVNLFYQVNSLAVSGTNLFAGTEYGAGNAYLSTNDGTYWTHVDSGLPKKAIYSLAVIGTNIFAGTPSGIYLTTNNGVSWTPIDSGLPSKTTIVGCLAVSGTSLFAATGYKNTGSNSAGIYLSTNNGVSWTPVDSGLPSKTVSANCFAASGNNIFVGTQSSGIFFSNNNGANWVPFNSGVTSDDMGAVASLAVSGNYLIAGIAGKVWRRPLSDTALATPVIPYNQNTTALQTKLRVGASATMQAGIKVNYSLASRCAVRLGIYTVTGEKIISFDQGEQAQGTFSVSLPTDKIQAGLYICRFQAGICRESILVRVMK